MSRLSIEISPKQHQHIKALAAMKGQSIKDFVIGKIFPSEVSEDQSWNELQQFLSARIEAAENGAISNKSITQITKEELGDRS